MSTASLDQRTGGLSLSLPNDLYPSTTSHRPYNGLNIQVISQSREWENLRTQGNSYRNVTTINMLTDNVLVEIFDFCRKDHVQYTAFPVWEWQGGWHLLVHVCRRWRQIIFASPRRLNLEILCTDRTPVRKNLGIWPDIPIVMQYGLYDWDTITPNDEDNVIAALEHPDRVSRVRLYITESQLGRITPAMQEPFPVLTHLSISSSDANVPIIPSGFLAGSAPRLQEIEFTCIPFPALPTLLLSVSDLVELKLRHIPDIGYISPEVMVAHLAALPRLKILEIGFRTPSPLPDQTLPPLTRTVLPALNYFAGVCNYMEDFVALIDAPQLRSIEIYYLDPIFFGVPQLSDRGFLHLTLVLNWISPVLSDTIHFAINSETFGPPSLPEDVDHFEWPHLLRAFSSAQTLFVAAIFAGHVSRVLEDIAGAAVTGVLPALDLLCLEDQPVSSVDEFVAVRRDSGRPVTIINTKKEFEKRLEAYPP
ncbi:hypothetical protein EDB84DRAFT_1560490 [Lactarius hengduanensis]|nr:hypothetical protein EDB84DRAFT_1560490 [Lactarius hengduanensis]